MPIPRLRYSAARTVRLYRRLLQSCADPLRHRLYHPTAGRGQSRVTRCPLFRGKVRSCSGDFAKLDCAACRHVAILTPEALLKVGLSPAAKVLDLRGPISVARLRTE